MKQQETSILHFYVYVFIEGWILRKRDKNIVTASYTWYIPPIPEILDIWWLFLLYYNSLIYNCPTRFWPPWGEGNDCTNLCFPMLRFLEYSIQCSLIAKEGSKKRLASISTLSLTYLVRMKLTNHQTGVEETHDILN